MNTSNDSRNTTLLAIEIAIRLVLLFLVLAWCLQILSPFISIVAWAAIIAVAVFKPFLKLVAKLGGRKKLAVFLTAVIGLAIIVLPMVSLSTSVVHGATTVGTEIVNGELKLPLPPDYIQNWPLIGEKTYEIWLQASQNLGELLRHYPHQLSVAGKYLLNMAAGVGAGVLAFIVSILIAAAFLFHAETAAASMHKLACRLSPQQGENLLGMAVSTIRSVAVGVIGIAFIQALLGGIGMLLAGVPAAGLLAIIILVLAIAQLPPILVLGPVAIYVFSGDSNVVAVIFLIWSILVSSADMVLKPLLLGRGVEVPMLVILLGAIGGMLTSGIVGLFIGAIVLALGYELLRAWLNYGVLPADVPAETE